MADKPSEQGDDARLIGRFRSHLPNPRAAGPTLAARVRPPTAASTVASPARRIFQRPDAPSRPQPQPQPHACIPPTPFPPLVKNPSLLPPLLSPLCGEESWALFFTVPLDAERWQRLASERGGSISPGAARRQTATGQRQAGDRAVALRFPGFPHARPLASPRIARCWWLLRAA
jgi:hypothetical protein